MQIHHPSTSYKLKCDGKIVSRGRMKRMKMATSKTLKLWTHTGGVQLRGRIFRAAVLKIKWTTVSQSTELVAT